jgi:radical SAM superfamily enzyme YgiQ (UPF0313 family)
MSVKFLLAAINSKYIHMNPAVYSLRTYVLGSGALNAGNAEIAIAEYTINQSMDEILGDLYERNPDVIGFSCYIWNWQMTKELIVEVKKLLPQTDIFLGGPEVSYEAEKIMEQYGRASEETGNGPVIRGIILGEGEKTFCELVEYYAQREDHNLLQDIKGLLLDNGYTGMREPLSFSEIPFLYEEQRLSGKGLQDFRNKIIYYESSRGCPFRCSYCLSSIDKTLRLRDLDRVFPELQFFLDCKVPQVKFIDRTFNCNRAHAMAIWQYLTEHDNGVTNFHFEIAAELITEEELELFQKMRPGLIQLEIGVQTTNPGTLQAIHRSADMVHLSQIVERIRAGHNIHVHLDLIAGLPEEDYESFVHSFNDVYAMKPEQLQLGFLKVLKGTEISLRKEEYGLVHQSIPPYEVLYTKWISYEEIRKLKRVEEMVELYYNSNQFIHTLAALVTQVKTPFELYEKLAEHYETHGYFINTPARVKRYDVLLEFACGLVPEQKELFRELLTFDFYLRENAKSRPAFCRDLTGDYEVIRQFYEQEEAAPHYLKEYAQYHARQVMKMTHMEMFHYPVWQQDADEWKQLEHPVMVLYDYQKRDPLTGDCATISLHGSE